MIFKYKINLHFNILRFKIVKKNTLGNSLHTYLEHYVMY